jgi:predicted transglutaminase-like cysteine proteinase
MFENIYSNDIPYVDKNTLKRIEKKYKVFAKKRFLYQQMVLDEAKTLSEIEKLKKVNDFYNQVRYAKDIKVYGKKDYWATPYEFLGHDRGDCEDYVIAKYFALKYLGVDPKKMYFTYARSTRFRAPHMVLTYFKTPKSEPLILDNINFKVFPASKRKDLKPIYLFNAETLYKARKKSKNKKVKNPKIHKKWDQLIENIKRKKI